MKKGTGAVWDTIFAAIVLGALLIWFFLTPYGKGIIAGGKSLLPWIAKANETVGVTIKSWDELTEQEKSTLPSKERVTKLLEQAEKLLSEKRYDEAQKLAEEALKEKDATEVDKRRAERIVQAAKEGSAGKGVQESVEGIKEKMEANKFDDAVTESKKCIDENRGASGAVRAECYEILFYAKNKNFNEGSITKENFDSKVSEFKREQLEVAKRDKEEQAVIVYAIGKIYQSAIRKNIPKDFNEAKIYDQDALKAYDQVKTLSSSDELKMSSFDARARIFLNARQNNLKEGFREYNEMLRQFYTGSSPVFDAFSGKNEVRATMIDLTKRGFSDRIKISMHLLAKIDDNDWLANDPPQEVPKEDDPPILGVMEGVGNLEDGKEILASVFSGSAWKFVDFNVNKGAYRRYLDETVDKIEDVALEIKIFDPWFNEVLCPPETTRRLGVNDFRGNRNPNEADNSACTKYVKVQANWGSFSSGGGDGTERFKFYVSFPIFKGGNQKV